MGSTCPDTPAVLFDAAGMPVPARPTLYLGLTDGAILPDAVRQRLDHAAIPYRVLPVAAPGHLALYAPDGVITGVAAILRRLGAFDAVARTP